MPIVPEIPKHVLHRDIPKKVISIKSNAKSKNCDWCGAPSNGERHTHCATAAKNVQRWRAQKGLFHGQRQSI